jgi:hypothetical protein
VLDFLFDLIADILAGGDAKTRRTRSLRRKLVRYLKNAGSPAFTGTDSKYLSPSGEIRSDVRGRVVAIGKKFDAAGTQDWELLLSAFLAALEKELPGVVIQLPPDEPRMVYAGDKQL